MRDEPEQTVEIADESPVDPGEMVRGKYRVGPLVGSGGMAVVVAAHHVELDQAVAIKLLLPEHAARPDAVRRFLAEARAAAKLKSEHVARVLDVGTHPSKRGPIIPFMVMELLQGQDLDAVIALRERLPVHEAVEYVLQACDAVAEAHAAGIIHRDLKPGNLFLTARRDGTPVIKLLDFGISKIDNRASRQKAESVTGDREMMGSPGYMSPEQVRSAKDVDARTDIWSLGVILYELLTGDQAFPADTIADVLVRILHSPPDPIAMRAPEVPEGLVAVVMRCLDKKRDGRYPDVESLTAALRPFRGVASIVVAPMPARIDSLAMSDGSVSVNTVRDTPKRRLRLAASLAVGAVVLGVTAAVSFAALRSKGGPDPHAGGGAAERAAATSAVEAPAPVAIEIPAPAASTTMIEVGEEAPSGAASAETAAPSELAVTTDGPAETTDADAAPAAAKTTPAPARKAPGPVRKTPGSKAPAGTRHRTDW